MDLEQRRLLALYLRGFALVFLHVAIVSLLALWVLQLGAAAFDEHYDWPAVLWQLYISLCLLVFFPGQTLWTYRLTDTFGKEHVIVGAPRRPETD